MRNGFEGNKKTKSEKFALKLKTIISSPNDVDV